MKQIISTITLSLLLPLFCFPAFAEAATDYCDLYAKLSNRLVQDGKDFEKVGGFDLANEGRSKSDQKFGQTVVDMRRVADGEHDAKLTAAVASLEKAFARKVPEQFRSSLDGVIAEVNRIYKTCKLKPKITVEDRITIVLPDGSKEVYEGEGLGNCETYEMVSATFDSWAGVYADGDKVPDIEIRDMARELNGLAKKLGRPALTKAVGDFNSGFAQGDRKIFRGSLVNIKNQMDGLIKQTHCP